MRFIRFKDGGVISITPNKDKISGLFMGSFGLQVIDKLKFRDEINEISAEVEFGSYFFKKQDFIWGEIK